MKSSLQHRGSIFLALNRRRLSSSNKIAPLSRLIPSISVDVVQSNLVHNSSHPWKIARVDRRFWAHIGVSPLVNNALGYQRHGEFGFGAYIGVLCSVTTVSLSWSFSVWVRFLFVGAMVMMCMNGQCGRSLNHLSRQQRSLLGYMCFQSV